MVVQFPWKADSLVSHGGPAMGDEQVCSTQVMGADAQSIFACVSLLESFADTTVQQEGAKTRGRLAELGLVS